MQVRQSSSIRYRTYNRGKLTFYITDQNKIYFETKLQRFVLCHAEAITFNNYQKSPKMIAVIYYIKTGKIGDINSLAHYCLREGVIWQAINKLPM
jgi:hypothetical protein